jgi:predicted nucleotidyltransferase
MVNNNKDTLNIIKKSTKEILPDSKVLLFGSRVRKDYSIDSDYDFLVITKKSVDIRQKRLYKSQLRKELAKYKIPADILIQSEAEVEVKKEIIGHIIREILKEGISI